MAVIVRAIARADYGRHIDGLAQLRIDVFRAWPYLYDGDLGYEASYLATYLKAQGAFIGGAFDGETLVGACTAAPLLGHEDAFAGPLESAGYTVSSIFYLGESVLLPAYRGQGAGVAFFALREAEARRQGFSHCVFCAVERADDHPLRPNDYVPLDAFWRRRGYTRIAGVQAYFHWRDVDGQAETEKPMRYWIKTL